jgi:hypothetical protein
VSRHPEEFGFSYQATRAEEVRILRTGRVVTTLRGGAALEFLADAEGAGDAAVQQLCARVTGNYKRGNEAVARNHPRNRRPGGA